VRDQRCNINVQPGFRFAHPGYLLIEEEFGDGIMSAIDFDMEIARQSDPKGDRVKIGLTGKFLPFKYYGATGNAMAVGYKEE